MHLTTFSKTSPIKTECEDALLVNEQARLFGVFDGVTPITDYRDHRGHNGAYIAANLFREHFEALKSGADIFVELTEANRQLRGRMESAGIDMTALHERWAACGAVISVDTREIRFVHVGDCMIISMDIEGNVTVHTRDYVEGVPARAARKRAEDRQRGIYVPDDSFFEDPRREEEYCRWMANSPEGYGVANGMEEMRDFIQTGSIDPNSVRYLLLMSDGLILPGQSPAEVLPLIVNSELAVFAEHVERSERVAGRRPDDKTCVLLRFDG